MAEGTEHHSQEDARDAGEEDDEGWAVVFEDLCVVLVGAFVVNGCELTSSLYPLLVLAFARSPFVSLVFDGVVDAEKLL